MLKASFQTQKSDSLCERLSSANNVVSGLPPLFISRPVNLRGSGIVKGRLASQQTVLAPISIPFERCHWEQDISGEVPLQMKIEILEACCAAEDKTALSSFLFCEKLARLLRTEVLNFIKKLDKKYSSYPIALYKRTANLENWEEEVRLVFV